MARLCGFLSGAWKSSVVFLVHGCDGWRFKNSSAAELTATKEHLQEHQVVAGRAEQAPASAEELRALSHLERRRLERSIRLPLVHGRYAPLLSAADGKSRVTYAERNENVFP